MTAASDRWRQRVTEVRLLTARGGGSGESDGSESSIQKERLSSIEFHREKVRKAFDVTINLINK